VLAEYRGMLTRFTEATNTPGAVTVILSGERPIQQVRAERERWCAIDGRLPDLATNPPLQLVPLVSDNWAMVFGRFPEGELSTPTRQKLRDIVNQAHTQGRRVRFWGTPDEPRVWGELNAAGVDLLNTDNLAGLAAFLRTNQPAPFRSPPTR